MSAYEKTLISINEVKTLVSHMAALGRLRINCPDPRLDHFIVRVIQALQYQHANSTAKSTPLALTFFPVPETVWLVDYCTMFIRPKKPEWQLIAEQNGWSPPPDGL